MNIDELSTHGDRHVFTRPFTLRKGNVTADFGSDTERVTRCQCTCGWRHNGTDALDVLNGWRTHVTAGHARVIATDVAELNQDAADRLRAFVNKRLKDFS